jgi:hypothetical protein
VAKTLEDIEKEMEETSQNKDDYERLLDRLTATQLHPGHNLALDLKFTMAQESSRLKISSIPHNVSASSLNYVRSSS